MTCECKRTVLHSKGWYRMNRKIVSYKTAVEMLSLGYRIMHNEISETILIYRDPDNDCYSLRHDTLHKLGTTGMIQEHNYQPWSYFHNYQKKV